MSETPRFAPRSNVPEMIQFGDPAVFRIEAGGRLVAGPGLSNDEATRALFACMVELFPDLMRDLANAETETDWSLPENDASHVWGDA